MRAAARYSQMLRRLNFDGSQLVSLRLPALLRLDRCSFVGADLRQATLDGARFKMCDLRGADLRGASLRRASFVACDLRGADLAGVRFGSVNTGDDTGGTVLAGAVFDRGVDLTALVEDGPA